MYEYIESSRENETVGKGSAYSTKKMGLCASQLMIEN